MSNPTTAILLSVGIAVEGPAPTKPEPRFVELIKLARAAAIGAMIRTRQLEDLDVRIISMPRPHAGFVMDGEVREVQQ